MDTRMLGYFVALSVEGTYSAAARKVGITPQGMSSAIKHLESELGVPLIDMSSGRAVLTDYGALVKRSAESVTGEMAGLAHGIQALRDHCGKIVRIGCSTGVPGYLGENLGERFAAENEGHELIIAEMPDTECEQRLCDGEFNVCLLTNPAKREGVVSGSVVDDFQFFWVNIRNKLSKNKEINLEDLHEQTVIMMNDAYKSTPLLVRMTTDAGVDVKFRYTGEMIRIYEMAQANLGLGLTCRNHILATGEASRVVGLPFKAMPWGFSVCYRRGSSLSEAEYAFIDFMRKQRRDFR